MTKKGFFMIANDIVLHYLPQLGSVGFLLYCVLRRMTDRNDRCYPSLNTLTRMTGIEEAQLKVELDRLEELQLMQRLQHTNSLNGKETEIYLLPLYPERLGPGLGEQSTPSGAQLSLPLPSDQILPKASPLSEVAKPPDKVDHPPNELQTESLISLMTLLMEQMREMAQQMGTLIQRMDRIAAKLPK